MLEPLDPETEQELRTIAIGKAVPAVERDQFKAGGPVTIYPEQLMSALRSAYTLNRR